MNKQNIVVMSQASAQMTIYIILLMIHVFVSTINDALSGNVYIIEIILMNAIGLLVGLILGVAFLANWPETAKVCKVSIMMTVIVYVLFTLLSIALYNF